MNSFDLLLRILFAEMAKWLRAENHKNIIICSAAISSYFATHLPLFQMTNISYLKIFVTAS